MAVQLFSYLEDPTEFKRYFAACVCGWQSGESYSYRDETPRLCPECLEECEIEWEWS